MRAERLIGGISIVSIPQSYKDLASATSTVSSVQHRAVDRNDSFAHMLGATVYTRLPIAFRITVNHGSAQVLLLTADDGTSRLDGRLAALTSAFSSQFPDFAVKPARDITAKQIPHNPSVATITGVPRADSQSLDALAQVMMRFDGGCIYQACGEPATPGAISKYLAEKKYEAKLQQAQRQRVESGLLGGQTTVQQFDSAAQRDAAYLERLVKRMNAAGLLRSSVTLGFWGSLEGEAAVRSAVAALIASLSEIDSKHHLGVKFHSGKGAEAVLRNTLRLKPAKATLLLPEEAAAYFRIPSVDLGLDVGRPADFATSHTEPSIESIYGTTNEIPFQRGMMALGNPFRGGTLDSGRVKYLSLDDLRHHVGVFGMTGMGKSTAKNRIIIDAWRNGVPSLIIEPVKTDARMLLGAIPEARIFTAGVEHLNPYRQNPFLVDVWEDIGLHIDLLYVAFAASWPLYGMLANHMRRLINLVYVDNGWDRVNNVRGSPITLEMFLSTTQRYCDEVLKYSPEMKQDFTGAILGRVEEMCEPHRASIFNPMENLSMEDLLSRPTIIELKAIGDRDFRALLLSLLLTRMYSYISSLGRSDGLRALLVIDEAHHLLQEVSGNVDGTEGAVSQKYAMDQLTDLIAEARSPGLGIVACEQSPTRLARDAIKNFHTKIVGRLTSPDDVRLMAAETGCNVEQAEHIRVLERGEAIVSDMHSAVPTKVRVFHDPTFCPAMNRQWTDDEIRQAMRQFYQEHPSFAERPRTPQLDYLSSREPEPEDSEPFQPVPSTADLGQEIDRLVDSDDFADDYMKGLEEMRRNPNSDLLEAVIGHYCVYFTPEGRSYDEAAQMLAVKAGQEFGVPPRLLRAEVIRNQIDATVRFLRG